MNSAGLLLWWKFVLELLLFVIQGLNSRRDCSHTWVLFWPLFLFPLAESADLPGASLNSHQPSTFLGRCSCKNQPFCSGLFGPQKTDVLQKCHTLRVTHHFQVLFSSLKEKKDTSIFWTERKKTCWRLSNPLRALKYISLLPGKRVERAKENKLRVRRECTLQFHR